MKRPRLAPRLTRRWPSLPPRTIRLRLTVIYAGLFLACGAALLAINYGLVSGRLTSHYFASVSVAASKEQISIARHGSSSGGATSVNPASASGGAAAASGRASGSQVAGGSTAAAPLITGAGLPNGVRLPSSQVLQATSVAASNAAHGALLIESGIALAFMALLAAGLGWIIAGRALRPLRAITATAREISASSLHRRLALTGPDDELRQLGHTFDALLGRLESAFSAQRQFAANVSHELRTPLTYERTLIEVALADPDASSPQLRAVLDQLLTAGEHQERLIEALLVLSRSQRGLDHREPVDLAAIAAHALEDLDAGGLTVERTLGPAPTDGDRRLIERLAANLLTNAVQYNRPTGRIDVITATIAGRAILRVTNTGPVIPAEDLKSLFEPFQRIDGTRTSTTDGLGLGLSIVQAIADAHAAAITTALPDDGGLSIEIAFPAADHRIAASPAKGPGEGGRSTKPPQS
jgi:signal transduction histidine kinase